MRNHAVGITGCNLMWMNNRTLKMLNINFINLDLLVYKQDFLIDGPHIPNLKPIANYFRFNIKDIAEFYGSTEGNSQVKRTAGGG